MDVLFIRLDLIPWNLQQPSEQAAGSKIHFHISKVNCRSFFLHVCRRFSHPGLSKVLSWIKYSGYLPGASCVHSWWQADNGGDTGPQTWGATRGIKFWAQCTLLSLRVTLSFLPKLVIHSFGHTWFRKKEWTRAHFLTYICHYKKKLPSRSLYPYMHYIIIYQQTSLCIVYRVITMNSGLLTKISFYLYTQFSQWTCQLRGHAMAPNQNIKCSWSQINHWSCLYLKF